MASKWKAVKPVSKQTETKQLLQSSNRDDNVNRTSCNKSDSDLVASEKERHSEAWSFLTET